MADIIINGKSIKSFVIVANSEAKTPVCSAADCFDEYVQKITGARLEIVKEGKGDRIEFVFAPDFSHDEYEISVQPFGISVKGGKRGVIYGAYELLERLGCRFFAVDCEVLPESDVVVPADLHCREKSTFEYRECLASSNYSYDKKKMLHFGLKRRFNSNFWSNTFTEPYGGGYGFAGISAHSLTGEFLLKPYVESHPEYFSLKNGKRHVDYSGQVCLSSEGALQATITEVKKLLREHPDRNFVSVSQGDNNNFCECENCKKLVAEKGLSQAYLEFVNKVAREVRKEFPEAVVHTFAYAATVNPPEDKNFALEPNVMAQYCTGPFCRIHSITDDSCEYNVEARKAYLKWSDICSYIFVWDYVNPFKYEMYPVPDFYILRENVRFFADTHVKGVFNENEHRAEDGYCNFCAMKTYLLSKVMWDPYMTKEEYESHMLEFANAYYGKGGKYLKQYIDMMCAEANGHCSYGGEPKEVKRDESRVEEVLANGFVERSRVRPEQYIPTERLADYCAKAEELFKKAYDLAENAKQRARVERDYASLLYFKQMFLYPVVTKDGTDEQKARLHADNVRLVELIRKYHLKLTFWGQTIGMQLDEMAEAEVPYEDLDPVEWNYRW